MPTIISDSPAWPAAGSCRGRRRAPTFTRRRVTCHVTGVALGTVLFAAAVGRHSSRVLD